MLVVDLDMICLKFEQPLTGVVFILKDCFTFYFTFSIQFCFHFSCQVSLLNLITWIVNGHLIFLPSLPLLEIIVIITPVSKVFLPIPHMVGHHFSTSHCCVKQHYQINTSTLAQVPMFDTKWNGLFSVIKSASKASAKTMTSL